VARVSFQPLDRNGEVWRKRYAPERARDERAV
jgi:hypothetical protein